MTKGPSERLFAAGRRYQKPSASSNLDTDDVYFGTNPNPGASEFQGNQPQATFDPGYLPKNTWYYWRIDEVNANGTTTGVVWSFRTGAQ